MKTYPHGYLIAGALLIVSSCGPTVESADDGDSSANTSSAPDTATTVGFDVSWALGEFAMPLDRDEQPVSFFMGLEVPEHGRATATMYHCDWDGGPAYPAVVTELEWKAVSDSRLEIIPPTEGEKFKYVSDRTWDLFIERPIEGDGLFVQRSDRDRTEWPRYGSFERGRPCGYFEGGMDCFENFYYSICPE